MMDGLLGIQEISMSLDSGDKLAVGLGYKRNIGNFSSFDWHVSITVTKRENESDEEFYARGWGEAQAQLEEQVLTSDELIAKVKPPIVGNEDDWN